MELERMGFDLTLLAFVVLGNSILVAGGACLVDYLKRVIKRWEEEQATPAYQSTDSNDYASTSTLPVSHGGRQESNQPDSRPMFTQAPVQTFA